MRSQRSLNKINKIKDAISLCTTYELQEVRAHLEKHEFALRINRFSAGKIYKICHNVTGQLGYVGSTIVELEKRWAGHKSSVNAKPNSRWSKYILKNGGVNSFGISLLENFPCQSSADLLEREKYHIQTLKPPGNVCHNSVSTAKKVPRSYRKTIEIYSFADLPLISLDKFQQLERKYLECAHSRLEAFLMEKHRFVSFITGLRAHVQDDVIENIFDEIMTDDRKYNLFISTYNLKYDTTFHKYKISRSDRRIRHHRIISEEMSSIVTTLKLKSFDDRQTIIDQQCLEESQEMLFQSSKKIRVLLGCRAAKSETVSIRTLIDSLSACFRGVGLELKLCAHHQHQVKGKRRWVSSWTLAATNDFTASLYDSGIF